MKCTSLLFWIYFCHGVTHRCLGGVRDPEPYKPCSCQRMENYVFQKLYYSVHATTRANLSPFCCPSYAKHTIPYFLYFLQTKKIQKFDTQENISLCQALGQCQWVRKVANNGWVMSERKKASILLTNTKVFSPTWHTRTMLTGYTYMYLSPSQLPCVFCTSFLDKLSLLSWSLEQAKRILECVSCCKLQTLWWLKCCM